MSGCTGSAQVCVAQDHFSPVAKPRYPGKDTTLLLSSHLGARGCPEPSSPSLCFFHDFVQSPAEPTYTSKTYDTLLQMLWTLLTWKISSFDLLFDVPPVSFIRYPVFLILKEGADNLFLSMLLMFLALSLPWLSYCFFRLRSPSCSINENRLVLLITLFCPPPNFSSSVAPFLKWGTRTATGIQGAVKSPA